MEQVTEEKNTVAGRENNKHGDEPTENAAQEVTTWRVQISRFSHRLPSGEEVNLVFDSVEHMRQADEAAARALAAKRAAEREALRRPTVKGEPSSLLKPMELQRLKMTPREEVS